MQAAAALHVLDKDAVWNSIQRNIHAILDGQKMFSFDEPYRPVYTMCTEFKAGRFVYDEVRQIVWEHVIEMVGQFEAMANNENLGNQINQMMLHVDEFWFNFTEQLELISDSLMFLEKRVMSQIIVNGELTVDFGWRIFRSEILENQLIKNALTNRLVFNRESGIQANNSADDETVDYKESPLFNVDTIIEIMTFLTTFKLGLQISTAARQMAKLSDYVLTKRKPILPPIAVFNGIIHNTEPFAAHLQKENAPNPEGKKMEKIFDDWFAITATENRICLPDIEPPEWLAGVELIYIMDGLNDKTFGFLNALHNQLQNCQLIFNLYELFAKLHKTGHSAQFFALFNERCFSLVQDNLPWHCLTNNFITKWPYWALFNGIFFPNCRELTLPYNLLRAEEMGLEVAKWLLHPSTEGRPRLLNVCFATASASEHWFRAGGAESGFDTMLGQIREDFFTPNGKRTFFVEFQKIGSNDVYGNRKGEWQNGNGEQLRISPTGITRLPVDQCHWEFKDFYFNQLPAVQPKVFFSAQNGPIRTITPHAECLHKENASELEGKKMVAFFDDWHTNADPESRICLPDIDPPEWLAGVELIYIMGDTHPKVFRLFNALRNQIQNCQLVLNQSEFFARLHKKGHSPQFFEFFNEHCFSLVLDIPSPQGSQQLNDTDQLFAAKWPLWGIFNGIFLPNCRELTLSIEIDEIDATAKWLMDPSTEHQPRSLKLRSKTGNWRDIGNLVVTMLRHINEDFFNPTGKCMFFVEFPKGTALPTGQQGEWQNGNGEQLRIEPMKITRLPEDQNEKDFKDFYQLPEVQPKLVFN